MTKNSITFTASRENIASALSRVHGAVAKRSTIPALSYVLVDIFLRQAVKLTASDLDVQASAEFTAGVPAAGGRLCILADQLKGVIAAAGPEITVTVAGDNLVVITSGDCRWELASFPADEFPANDPAWLSPEFAFQPGVLPGMIQACSHAISHDESRYNLGGIYLCQDAGRLTAVATDGHRLSLAGRQVDGLESLGDGLLLHAKATALLAGVTGTVELSRLEKEDGLAGQVLFQANSGDLAYAVRLIDAEFPTYRRVIPTGNAGCVTLDADQLIEAVEACLVVADGKSRAVTLEVQGETLTVSAHSPTGRCTSTVPCSPNNDDMQLYCAVGSRYLLQALKSLGGEINIKHGLEVEPLLLVPTDLSPFDERLEVVMPVRL